jgi:hypothetical protein
MMGPKFTSPQEDVKIPLEASVMASSGVSNTSPTPEVQDFSHLRFRRRG